MAAKKTYVFELTEEQADAIIQVSLHLCDDLGPPKKFTTLGHFSEAGVALDEAKANQDRTWEKCEPCGGSGWIEEDTIPEEQIARPVIAQEGEHVVIENTVRVVE